MTWIIVTSCLLIGVIIGLLIGGRLSANPNRVRELEAEIKAAQEKERRYRDSVSDHFSMTADLVHHMTESYREVYEHLASGAQDLCPDDVASKLLPSRPDAKFQGEGEDEEIGALVPPKDYAAKATPDQKGALAEGFGLEKPTPQED